MILNGGYERFSALYPFLKSIQVIYSPRVMKIWFINTEIIYFFYFVLMLTNKFVIA